MLEQHFYFFFKVRKERIKVCTEETEPLRKVIKHFSSKNNLTADDYELEYPCDEKMSFLDLDCPVGELLCRSQTVYLKERGTVASSELRLRRKGLRIVDSAASTAMNVKDLQKKIDTTTLASQQQQSQLLKRKSSSGRSNCTSLPPSPCLLSRHSYSGGGGVRGSSTTASMEIEGEAFLELCQQEQCAMQQHFNEQLELQCKDQIFISFGRSYTLAIDIRACTVEELKVLIEKKLFIPKQEFWLCCQNKILSQGRLQDFEVRRHSTIHVNLRLLSCRHSESNCTHYKRDEASTLAQLPPAQTQQQQFYTGNDCTNEMCED